ncbi:AraC family transcriptional regulator ligand-binding domain-containing protein [Nocardia sp. NPDC059240]|uniref:helix-turn-helix transcriptional regulator n=1 Tax=Nocardia sp. NPDC059240 TaxID=3346786 RepID=UPI003689AD1C
MTAPVSTVSTHVVGVLVDAARAAGASESEIARALGGDPTLVVDRAVRVATTDSTRMWALLYELAGAEAGVLAAEYAEHGRLYVWDYLISTAPTLAEGLRAASVYNATICDRRVELEVREDGSLLTASYSGAPHREPYGATHREFAMVVTARRAREGFGDAGIPVRVDFSHPAPRDRGYLVRAFGTGNIHFGQDRDALTFFGAAARPNDRFLHAILRRHARQALDDIGPEPPWLEVFRGVLRGQMSESPAAKLEDVAAVLSLSGRTLQRRLAEHGTTWRAELETVRRDLAIALLRDRSDSVGSIAAQLGYRDHRVLARAFRRWTGRAPADFRRMPPE